MNLELSVPLQLATLEGVPATHVWYAVLYAATA